MKLKWEQDSIDNPDLHHLMEEYPEATVPDFDPGWAPVGRVEPGRPSRIFGQFWYAVLYGSPSTTGHFFDNEKLNSKGFDDAREWLEEKYNEAEERGEYDHSPVNRSSKED